MRHYGASAVCRPVSMCPCALLVAAHASPCAEICFNRISHGCFSSLIIDVVPSGTFKCNDGRYVVIGGRHAFPHCIGQGKGKGALLKTMSRRWQGGGLRGRYGPVLQASLKAG